VAHGHTGPAMHGGPRQLVGAHVRRALGGTAPVVKAVLERALWRRLGGTRWWWRHSPAHMVDGEGGPAALG
jgi:hypothetical protein